MTVLTSSFQAGSLTLHILTPEKVGQWRGLRAAWQRLDDANDSLYALYQSSTWWDHLQATHDVTRLHLGVVVRPDESIRTIVPLESTIHRLPLNIGSRALGEFRFSVASAACVELLPGEPASPIRLLLSDMVAGFPGLDGLFIKSVDADTPLWAEIANQPGTADCLVYVPDGVRQLYSIALPATFDEYLKKFSAKTRNTFRRKVKALEKEAADRLTLVRVDAESNVEELLDGANEVTRNSWRQGDAKWKHLRSLEGRSQLEDAASRRFLRAYLLKAGNVPCAFVNGYQYRGIYHYSDLAYDERFAKQSPGLVLLLLLIEDLIVHNRPRRLNFGIGYADYKQLFANEETRDASILMLRKSLANKARVRLHAGLGSLKQLVKKLV